MCMYMCMCVQGVCVCRVYVCAGCMCVQGVCVCRVYVCAGCMCVQGVCVCRVYVCAGCMCVQGVCVVGVCVVGVCVCRVYVCAGCMCGCMCTCVLSAFVLVCVCGCESILISLDTFIFISLPIACIWIVVVRADHLFVSPFVYVHVCEWVGVSGWVWVGAVLVLVHDTH